jgi:ubiquinone/menaquinone biosynthesis C-methylase UbiE
MAKKHRVCPWWLGYLLASRLRRFLQNPGEIVAPYVREGMTVLEPGPGMGFFTLEMARRVGASGRVVAVDIQPKMLAVLKRRVGRLGLLERVDARLVPAASMDLSDISGAVDFALAFAVVHEVPDPGAFFKGVSRALKPGACLLLAEPSGHVKAPAFDAELSLAAEAALTPVERPVIKRSHAALLKKT